MCPTLSLKLKSSQGPTLLAQITQQQNNVMRWSEFTQIQLINKALILFALFLQGCMKSRPSFITSVFCDHILICIKFFQNLLQTEYP